MTLTIVAVIFGVFASSLIVLLIYKSTLTMHRDDQLLLDDASSHMHAERPVGQGQPAYHPDAVLCEAGPCSVRISRPASRHTWDNGQLVPVEE